MNFINVQFANSKIALVEGNRSINQKRLLNVIREDGGVLIPIIVVKYDSIKDLGVTLIDVESGEAIKNPSDDYLVIADGQHRFVAAKTLYEESMKNQSDDTQAEISFSDHIEAVLYDVQDLKEKNLLTFISRINSTAKGWSSGDFVKSAHDRKPDDILLALIFLLQELGFSISNISRVLALNHKAINSLIIINYVDGCTDLSHIQYARGLEILRFLLERGFSMKFLKKRYLWEEIIKMKSSDKLEDFLIKLSTLDGKTIDEIENKMKPTEYDCGCIKDKVKAHFDKVCQERDVEAVVLNTSDEKVSANRRALENKLLELRTKKNKPKATKTKSKVNRDVTTENIK